jgi:hypothetical protein
MKGNINEISMWRWRINVNKRKKMKWYVENENNRQMAIINIKQMAAK